MVDMNGATRKPCCAYQVGVRQDSQAQLWREQAPIRIHKVYIKKVCRQKWLAMIGFAGDTQRATAQITSKKQKLTCVTCGWMPHYQCRLQACLSTLNGPDPGLSPQSLKLNQSLGHSVVGAHYALGVLAGHERLVLSKPAKDKKATSPFWQDTVTGISGQVTALQQVQVYRGCE